ncbi:MAG: amino acid permease [Phaeodactylibacter sp.]|uniref:APC family permease n=1 Tax=Phaeodactylibacter sp. TaxID=1940289 RepID=UPI0032EC2A9B
MHTSNGRKIGWVSAAAIVVANMIGTGVFTSLGLQVGKIGSIWSILLLWVLGGFIALMGAFSYAELGTRLPKSGGEYNFLYHIYHPFMGYLAGWVSLTVGFAASVALAAMAMGKYAQDFLPVSPNVLAVGVIVLISLAHSFSIRQSSNFQNGATAVKLLLMLFFIVACFVIPAPEGTALKSATFELEIGTSAFMIGLVYVTYSFSGWNAAAYIVEEIRTPSVNLPKALILGTLTVSLLYVLLQAGFLYQASVQQLNNEIEVGKIVAHILFGPTGGRLMSLFVSLFLISSISASIWVGPRVVRAMADDFSIWHFLAKDNASGVPVRAVWMQAGISLFMVLTSPFDRVFLYSGFVLQLFTTLSVAGLLILRWREGKAGYSSPGYPWVQIVFLAISIWIIAVLIYDKPRESLMGAANLLVGAISYWWSRRYRS